MSGTPPAGPQTSRFRPLVGSAAGLALALVIVSVSYITRTPSTTVSAARTFSATATAATPAPASPAQLTSSSKHNPDDSNFDAATQQLLNAQIAQARQVALRYPTLADALADGFTLAASYVPGIGSHYMKYSRIYQAFTVSAPSMLLFNGDIPTSKIVGLAYYVYDSQGPPAGFAGPLDHWHQHWATCVGPRGAHFDGDDGASECRHRGHNAWMLHLWVVPGLQTPKLIFSDSCNILT